MAGNDLKYGLQTYNTAGEIGFSTENYITNVVITGYVDITTRNGEFIVSPPAGLEQEFIGKRVFYFPTFSLYFAHSNIDSPFIRLYPLTKSEHDPEVVGFAWVFWAYYDDPPAVPITPEAPPLRIYYGYY